MDDGKFVPIKVWLFQSKYCGKSIAVWILILSLSVCNTIIGLYSFFRLLSRPLPLGNIEIISYLQLFFGPLCALVQAILIFTMKWSTFWDYVHYCGQLKIDRNSDHLIEMVKKRRIKILQSIVAGLIVQYILFTVAKNLNTFMLIIIGLAAIGGTFLLIIMVDTSVCLASLFEIINSSIKTFKFIGPSDVQLDRLINLRKDYFYLVQATISAESFFRNLITLHYIENSVQIIMTIYQISKISDQSLYKFELTLIEVFIVFQLTSNLTNVHVTSRKSLEDLYELALKTDCISIGDEVSKIILKLDCLIN